MSTADENDEIKALLMALESEGIENVDWDELTDDNKEVEDIAKIQDLDQDSSDDHDNHDKVVHKVINKQAPQQKESEESGGKFEVVKNEEEEKKSV